MPWLARRGIIWRVGHVKEVEHWSAFLQQMLNLSATPPIADHRVTGNPRPTEVGARTPTTTSEILSAAADVANGW